MWPGIFGSRAPSPSVVRKAGERQLAADVVIVDKARAFGFLGDAAEIDEIVILFVVHDSLHSLSIAAERSIRRLVPLPVISDAISPRSEEHTSELQSLMRISYAV